MVVGSSIQTAQAAQSTQIQIGLAQVDRLRDGEDKIKAAQGIDICLSVADGSCPGVRELIGDASDIAADQADIPVLRAADLPQPAFDVDFLAGAVHLAVIEHDTSATNRAECRHAQPVSSQVYGECSSMAVSAP